MNGALVQLPRVIAVGPSRTEAGPVDAGAVVATVDVGAVVPDVADVVAVAVGAVVVVAVALDPDGGGSL